MTKRFLPQKEAAIIREAVTTQEAVTSEVATTNGEETMDTISLTTNNLKTIIKEHHPLKDNIQGSRNFLLLFQTEAEDMITRLNMTERNRIAIVEDQQLAEGVMMISKCAVEGEEETGSQIK